ncbi:hypothetical protein ACFO6R_00840 [Eubacterium multiforme]|uniref:Mannitol-specific phosphotransferase system IIBC component n=1 Tax=Eubacterium multiforme TaxID=83339 RepID=A0ABT9UPZ2_9FIRM|nr:hypothetical protein [Eubacterium multiforme]MDQ0148713.1 mannitol-specific phosphotransferase system IIBC component [Eubacterium multiforme]
MGYTRYNYKPKKKPGGNFFLGGVIIILLAIVIGLLLGKVLFPIGDDKNKATVENKENDKINVNEEENKERETSAEVVNTEEKKIFTIIQCGVYSKKDNAEKSLDEIPSSFNKFIIEEKEKFRVIAGIYSKEKGDKISEDLGKKKITNVKINCDYSINNKEEKITYEIITGFMKILDKLDNTQVRSVNTTDFKKWTSDLLKNPNNKIENEDIEILKKHIEKLPKELDRKGAKKSLEFIYKILIKHRM